VLEASYWFNFFPHFLPEKFFKIRPGGFKLSFYGTQIGSDETFSQVKFKNICFRGETRSTPLLSRFLVNLIEFKRFFSKVKHTLIKKIEVELFFYLKTHTKLSFFKPDHGFLSLEIGYFYSVYVPEPVKEIIASIKKTNADGIVFLGGER